VLTLRAVAGMSVGVGWKTATVALVLWVVTLTVWATVAAGVITGPWGPLAGAVLTALAAVAAGYVPVIRDGVLRRRAELTRRHEDAAAAREALRRAGELAGDGPAGLLDPRRGLVEFTGRERELDGLLGWCQDGRPRGVRLVTGPGGVGKTRLSVEVCARLEPAGSGGRTDVDLGTGSGDLYDLNRSASSLSVSDYPGNKTAPRILTELTQTTEQPTSPGWLRTWNGRTGGHWLSSG